MASRSSMDMDEKTSNSNSSSASSMLSCHTTLSNGSSGSGGTAGKDNGNASAAGRAPPTHSARNSRQPAAAARRSSEDGSIPSQAPSRSPPERGWNSGPSAMCRGSAANQRKVLEQTGANAFLRVLVAEDNLVNQKVLLKVLQRVTPHSPVFVANNGQEALQVGFLSLCPAMLMTLPMGRH